MPQAFSTDDHAAERAFYIQEFARSTVVVALDAEELVSSSLAPVVDSLGVGAARLVLVVGTTDPVADAAVLEVELAASLPGPASVHPLPVSALELDEGWTADLWLSVLDHGWVAVTVPAEERSVAAGRLAASLRALKLVVTDRDGGWGRPPRSFADVSTHRDAYRAQLGERQGGAVVDAIEIALGGGVTSVNLCRPSDLDRELFTFDGTGTLFTSGGYVEVGPLSIDDLAAVEELVAQGTADGLLRPRTRREIARMAVGGLGAKVIGRGHLAGMVGLETEPYRGEGVGEVAGLYTVSRFSGSGAGGALIDGLVERAADQGLRAIFAVTVSEVAGDFFVRRGFVEIDRSEAPAAKWRGYDAGRMASARVFWCDLEGDRSGF